MSKGQKMKRTFHDNLILNRYLLSLFNQDNLEKFKQRLGDDRFEGIDNDGQTKFFHELIGGQLFQTDLISENDLRRYDLNIVKHWKQITEHRNKAEGHILKLKYFQYLSLLFTEIYLDFYFNRPNELLNQLNEQLVSLKENDNAFPDFDLYELSDLNKLAFWNATGSGKTLLMHVNILQYQHYQKNKDLTVFVITPNEGLSEQHLVEFTASSLPATLFDKNKPFQGTGLFNDIQIMDINKLADKDGELTVAVDRFLDLNKLVLVDEGHRGSSGDQWIARRQKLIGDGFAFEYSATFGQAVKDGKTVKDCLFDVQKKIGKANGISKKTDVQKIPTSFVDKQEAKQKAVFETYAKCVLFDYSYKFFYADGYGKEFSILNMKAEDYGVADNDRKYFLASLLSFYQQLYLFAKNQEKLITYNLHKPLWVFVGNTVNAENSDIWAVVEQLAYFLDVKNTIFIKNIEDVINVIKDDVWKQWAQELQFLAQCSLAYSKDKFDRERSERIREIACEMLSFKYDLPLEKIKMDFAGEIGYQTPKVETRAAVIKDNKILLVKEQFDGKWALPGGYQDVNMSIRENVIKESSEEAGAVVNPIKVVAVLDYNRHHHVNFPYGMVKIFVLCEYIMHSFNENTETLGADFFSLDDLPELSITRTTKKQLEMCFECYKNPQNWDTIFD